MHSPTAKEPPRRPEIDDREKRARARLAFEVSELVARNLTLVTDPEDIAAEVEHQRKRKFHCLIRRYVSQIQYGCKNPSCTTPTCLSCRKKLAKSPVRKYTALSARTLACFLAEDRDPEAALCRDELVFPVDAKNAPTSLRKVDYTSTKHLAASANLVNNRVEPRLVHDRAVTPDALNSGFPKGWRNGALPKTSPNSTRRHSGRRLTPNLTPLPPPSNKNLEPAPGKRELKDSQAESRIGRPSDLPRVSCSQESAIGLPLEKAKKDPTSFTQILFDTLPLRLMEWLPSVALSSFPLPTLEQIQGTKSHTDSIDYQKTPQTQQADMKRKENTTHRLASATKTEDFDSVSGTPKPPHTFVTDQTSVYAIMPQPGPCKTFVNEYTIDDDQDNHGDDDKDSLHSSFGVDSAYAVPSLISVCPEILWEMQNLPPLPSRSSGVVFSDFVRQSLFFCLKDPGRLSMMFRDAGGMRFNIVTGRPIMAEAEQTPLPSQGLARIGTGNVETIVPLLYSLQPAQDILTYVSIAIHGLFVSGARSKITTPFSTAQSTSVVPPSLSETVPIAKNQQDRHLSDWQAARLCIIGLHALSEFAMQGLRDEGFAEQDLLDRTRSMGRVMPLHEDYAGLNQQTLLLDFPISGRRTVTTCRNTLALVDNFDDQVALDLLEKIVGIIASRWTHWEISKLRNAKLASGTDLNGKAIHIMQMVIKYMEDDALQRHMPQNHFRPGIIDRSRLLSRWSLSWMRTILVRDWNGKPTMQRAGTVGSILRILAAMYEKRSCIDLEAKDFWTPVLARRLNTLEMPVEWLSFRADNKTIHLLSFSFLFPPETVVTYFRAINYATMTKSLESVAVLNHQIRKFAQSRIVPIPQNARLVASSETTKKFFVLQVRRDDLLTDTIDQIWACRKQDLMKPLKVIMGKDEGEDGFDLGGVQQEFFRLLFAKALIPDYGMFTVDEETSMTWFQPGSLEPLYKFEALGVLMSIAVYNSVTLPITFPIAFYRKLLSFKVKKLDHVKDGWPVLAKNLQEMLDFKEGDVGDVYMRTYEFSYEAFGKQVSVEMEKIGRDVSWPRDSSKKGKEKVKTASFDLPIGDFDAEFEAAANFVSSMATLNEGLEQSATSTTSSAKGNEEFEVALSDDSLGDFEAEAKALENLPLRRAPMTESLERTATSTTASSTEASIVNNANREQYVKDYIFWLTDKSIRPQYEAFARGFYTCLDRTALSIFTAEALQSVVEGIQDIDIEGLQRVTHYEVYTGHEPVVKWFWEVVKSWDHEKRKKLLEFVTASDRLPVNGVNGLEFTVQRHGISNQEQLPSSMTCFGKLLLPDYKTKQKLEEKLGKAVEEARGFGIM